jgi:acetoin utilization deacetylase AcuC-like enzyme
MDRRRALRLLGFGTLAGAAGSRARGAPGGAIAAAIEVDYTPGYVGAAHAFETTRKAAWVAASLAAAPIAGLRLRANAPLRARELLRLHAPAYVEAVRTGTPRALAESQGFAWDPGLWPMVLASNGGALAAARRARAGGGVAGCLASGLHHARRDHGAGFCTFNGLALAALDAAEAGARVLVLDLDAHCGGGTHSLVGAHSRVRQLDVAVDGFDEYTPIASNTLDLVARADDYLPTVQRRLAALARAPIDLVVYNAGMDPHEGCAVGGLAGVTAALLARREALVFAWAARRRLPIAFVLAGGYLGPGLDRAGLVDLHRLTLAAAARHAAR